MSGFRRALAGAALLLTALVVPSTADVKPGGFMSANVTWVATIPLDAPGIGGRVLTVGGQRRFYVSGAKGLTIYDVSVPWLPVVLGELPLPHFENESLAVSDDGSTVVITSDPGFFQPPLTYVVDTSLVQAPEVTEATRVYRQEFGHVALVATRYLHPRRHCHGHPVGRSDRSLQQV